MKNALPFLFVGFHDTTRIRQKRDRNVTRLRPECGIVSYKMHYFDERGFAVHAALPQFTRTKERTAFGIGTESEKRPVSGAFGYDMLIIFPALWR
jgi:hypothetical protein